jgi:Tfp pilus assembly protein PilO
MSLFRLTRREISIAIICLVFALAYGAIFGIIKPFMTHKEELAQEIEAKKMLLNKYVETIDKAKDMESKYHDFLDQFQQNDTNDQVMTQLLSQIEKQATELGLRISDLKPRRVKKEKFYNRFSVSLSLDSSLIDITKFLYILQTEPYLFYVDEFTIEKGMQRQNDSVKTYLVVSKIFISK